jgi:hypothetical protein
MKWKLELTVIVVVLFVIVLFIVPKQNMLSITGFVSTETQRQQVNLEISQSTSFLLKNVIDAPLSVMHLSITGSVVGDGAAQVFLKDGARQVLVYSNIHKKKTGLIGITGSFVDVPAPTGEQGKFIEILQGDSIQTTPTVPEGYETAEESFKDSCVESCTLSAEFYNNEGYTLDVLVSPETTINIDEIDFILAKE